MRLALATTLLAAALVTPFAACGGDDGGGGKITDAGTWLDTYIGKLCTKAHECKADWDSASNGPFEDTWGADVTACKGNFLTADQVRTSVSSGKTTFNADAGEQCLAMLMYDTQTCPQFWSTNDPAVCGTVFTGTVAANGACANGLECMSGLFCDPSSHTCMSTNVNGPGAGMTNIRAAVNGF